MGGYRVRVYLAVLAWLPAIPVPATTPRDMLPDRATIETGYTNRDSVEIRLSGSALHPIEGIWQMTGDGAVIAIEQSQPYTSGQTLVSGYRIVLIQSPCRRIRPGTIMGYATQSAKSGRYDAAIYASSTTTVYCTVNAGSRSNCTTQKAVWLSYATAPTCA